MKKMTKRWLACILAVMMVLCNMGIYFPEGAPTAEASASSNTPTYMAKIVATSEANHSRTGQHITVTPGATYTLSYDMYTITSGRLQLRIGEDLPIVHKQTEVGRSTETGTYTAPDNASTVYFNIQVAGGEFYIWNIRLTEVKADGTPGENILLNADFTKGDGSWIDWKFSDWGGSNATSVTTVEQSNELEVASGRKVILYNEALFSEDIANREELEKTEKTPEYMAKIVATSEANHSRTGQHITVTPGATYTLSYDMYTITSGRLQLRIGEDLPIVHKQTEVGRSTETGTYTAPDNASTVYFNIQVAGGEFYIWNIRLTEVKADGTPGTNILLNTDFTKGDGSWIDWKFSDWGGSNAISVTTVEQSNELESASGRKIIAYNEQLFSADVQNREDLEDGKTPTPGGNPDNEELEGIPTGDPAYMAKIQVASDANWQWIYQSITPEMGKTYRFTCNYYVKEGNGGNAVIWSKSSGDNGVSGKLKADTQGTIDVSLTAQAGDDSISARFECEPGTTVYVWNACLREENGEHNLLKNGSFSKEEGTWIGWKVVTNTTVTDKAASDAIKTTYGHEILPFTKDILPKPEELEGIPTGDPAYMAKIQQKADAKNWLWIYQGIQTEQGKTYKFTCDYYVANGESGTVVLWSSNNGTNTDERSAKLKADTQGKIEITYELPAGDDRLNVRFETAPGTVCYVWNVCLSEENGEYNLLKNGSFSKEAGSWIGWQIGQSAVIKDKTESLAATEQYGPEIIAFNKDILPQPEVPEGIPSGDPAYMAKIQQKADAKNWIWIYQGIQTEQGKTYKFTCDYYVADGESGKAVVWSSNNGKNTDEKSAQLKADTQGKIEITYKLPAGDDRLNVRFETAPGTVCYVWNVCLSEENGTVNLLKNGSFSKENGSWTGWQVGQSGVIKNKAASDAATEKYGPAIIAFNKDILPKPEVPEGIPTGDPTYMAKIQQKADAKNWLWIYQGIDTTQGKTYKFTCNYYVAQGESGKAVVWSSNNGKTTEEKSAKLTTEKQGTIEIVYQLPAGDDRLNVRFETAPGTVCYVWNVCLSEEGGNVNLLKNGSFSKDNGSWIGWQVGQSGVIKNKAASDAATEKYGPEIVAFDSSIFPKPKGIPTGDPLYMAKLTGTHMDKSGKMNTYVNVRQSITPEPGKTYIFSCNYYDRASDAGASILLWSDTSKGSEGDAYGRFRARTQSGVEGKLELKYTATEGDTYIAVSMECDPDSECYMWNFCLREEGTEDNMLKNVGFEAEDGTWIGWTVGSFNVKTKADSDKLTELYGHKIMKFTRKFIEDMKAEDASLKTYQDPNRAFSFDDINKYKDLDASLLKLAAQKDTADGDTDADKQSVGANGIWIATIAIASVGLVSVGGVLFVKKRKIKKM